MSAVGNGDEGLNVNLKRGVMKARSSNQWLAVAIDGCLQYAVGMGLKTFMPAREMRPLRQRGALLRAS